MKVDIDLQSLKKEFEAELQDNILPFWMNEVYDSQRRIFYGRITNDGQKYPDAPLSAVFVTRILWTFSSAYRLYQRDEYKKMADEAFRVLQEMFWDDVNGGIYWSVAPDGEVLDSRKQFYAEAFFIYALSEYYQAFHVEKSKQLAISVFMLIEKYAWDTENGGYIEARSADWQEAHDQRLSEKEMDVKKSMNTHLHILEAYTNLFRIWKSDDLERQLLQLMYIFHEIILDPANHHFRLFFDEDWTVRSETVSYGHDIEGSWLLYEAAELMKYDGILEKAEMIVLQMAEAAAREGLGKEGGMYNEKEGETLHEQYDWWPQAEAVIGFYNVYQLTQDDRYLALANQSWEFIKRYIIDSKNGDWYWGVNSQLIPLDQDKVNGWKAPYHNGRMCMEMIRRIKKWKPKDIEEF
jgi:cellobiose epimerase